MNGFLVDVARRGHGLAPEPGGPTTAEKTAAGAGAAVAAEPSLATAVDDLADLPGEAGPAATEIAVTPPTEPGPATPSPGRPTGRGGERPSAAPVAASAPEVAPAPVAAARAGAPTAAAPAPAAPAPAAAPQTAAAAPPEANPIAAVPAVSSPPTPATPLIHSSEASQERRFASA